MTKSINDIYGDLFKAAVDAVLTARSMVAAERTTLPMQLSGAVALFCAKQAAEDTMLLTGRTRTAHGVFANIRDDGRFGCYVTVAGRDGERAELEHFFMVWFAQDRNGRNTHDEGKVVSGQFLRLVGPLTIRSVATRVVPSSGGECTIEVIRPKSRTAPVETYYEGDKIEI